VLCVRASVGDFNCLRVVSVRSLTATRADAILRNVSRVATGISCCARGTRRLLRRSRAGDPLIDSRGMPEEITNQMEDLMSMLKMVLLCALTMLAVSAVGASGASAAIKYEWSINGTPLAAGQSEHVTLYTDSAAPTITFQSTVLNTDIELSSNKLKGADLIDGGKPGTDAGRITFENVEVVKPKKCALHSAGGAAGIVETNELKSEIVEGVGANAGKPLVLFSAREGEIITTLEYENKGSEECALKGEKANLTGSIVALQNKPDTEKLQLFVFQPFGTKSKSSAGEEHANELKLDGNAVKLVGSISAEITKLLPWGAL
jgi:hypothetical protein